MREEEERYDSSTVSTRVSVRVGAFRAHPPISTQNVTHICSAVVVPTGRTGKSWRSGSLLRDSQERVVTERTDGHCASLP